MTGSKWERTYLCPIHHSLLFHPKYLVYNLLLLCFRPKLKKTPQLNVYFENFWAYFVRYFFLRYCNLFFKIHPLKLILRNRVTLFLTITLICSLFCRTAVKFEEDKLKLLEIMTKLFFNNPKSPEMSLIPVYFSSCAAF